jgi:hypothetical protein
LHCKGTDSFEVAFRGGPENLQIVKTFLEKDPRRHMYETSNPRHMVNLENSFGLRPLYIACLHGHLDVTFAMVNYV